MSYLEFYKLTEQPFANAPDNRFYYESVPHQEAMTRVQHAIEGMRGLAMLVGEVGTGKTTLTHRLMESLDPDLYEALLMVVLHSDVEPAWLVRRLCLRLGLKDPGETKALLVNQLYDRLLRIHQDGRKCVVIIDEASMLNSREVMEELRGLLNLELDNTRLITFILVGLPELDDVMAIDKPLRNRVALRFTLHSLNPTATRSYIDHRLRIAGCVDGGLFHEECYDVIYRSSKGKPRLINTICDNCLLEGYLSKQAMVLPTLVEDVVIGLGI
jgi:general secretion pathway protein A